MLTKSVAAHREASMMSCARLLGLAAALALLAPFGAARAQPSPAADAGVVSACLAGAGNLEPACIGAVAEACLNTADSTQRMGDCETRELKVWDGWLNRDYAAAMARLPVAAKTELRAIERAFVADKDRRCGFVATVGGPTTMNTPHIQECQLRATAIQWLWLKDFKTPPAR